jgi:sulfide:quinone oxidoreductase
MDIRTLNADLSVSPQVRPGDLVALKAAGFHSLICNRPDGEGSDQPLFSEIERAAQAAGLETRYLPAEPGKVGDDQGKAFGELMALLPKPVLAYCRTGMRSASMWALSQASSQPHARIVQTAKRAGYDLSGLLRRMESAEGTPPAAPNKAKAAYQIVIVGGGAAGIATASSLLKRDPGLDIAIIEPSETHYYQPGWTLVGAGIFNDKTTARAMGSLIPPGVHWIKAAVASFAPERNEIILDGDRSLRYTQLIVCPGLKLNWAGIEGLPETLGRNGVTSNYLYHLAPYTWELVQQLRGGRAIFTQPAMPIKCAGAPQKAMYLSADHWRRQGVLRNVDIAFMNTGGALFGVPEYVPALMEYVTAYGIKLNFGHTLTAIDGPAKVATLKKTNADGTSETIETPFDMIHVVPPQTAPDFIRVSALADSAGWVDVDPVTLRHKKYPNIHGLGDVTNTPNAKTAAAARKQAPVVANNVLVELGRLNTLAKYDGYGSCPLTVERGKVVLAEFLYGGKLAPSFPKWLIDGTRPSRAAWFLKERVLPPLYWEGMLKGREWMANPVMGDQ